MPTNIIRNAATRSAKHSLKHDPASVAGRVAVLTAGKTTPIRIQFAATETAYRIWLALPIYSIAETWGDCVHFEIPVDVGRDRTAKLNGTRGEIYFWAEDDRIVIPFGQTPISKMNEMRLPRPCNVWAIALDDLEVLAKIQPGQKITLIAEDKPATI